MNALVEPLVEVVIIIIMLGNDYGWFGFSECRIALAAFVGALRGPKV